MNDCVNPFDQMNRKNFTVLLVDDSAIMHAIMKPALSKAAYSLLSAMNVTEAMSIIATVVPDIIISDAMMPGVSGFDFIRQIKSRSETSGIPVILMTALEGENGRVFDASCKADFCIGKPFKLCEVIESLKSAESLIANRRTQSLTPVQ